jgi:hypothetical protein
MMRQCWEWMMSLGWTGMLLGVVLVAALIVMLIGRTSRGSPRP